MEQSNFFVIGFMVSFLINGALLILMFASGVGQETFRRWINKFKYKKGGYVNGLKFYKDGNVKETFTKKREDNAVLIGTEMHTVNPLTLRFFKGIPTQIYLEGNIAPVDIYKEHIDLKSISDEEVNKIIISNSDGMNLFKWIANNALIFFIILGVFALVAGAGLYFNYQIFDVLVQGAQVVSNGEVPGEVLSPR